MSKPDCWMTPDEISHFSDALWKASDDMNPIDMEESRTLHHSHVVAASTAQLCARLDRVNELLGHLVELQPGVRVSQPALCKPCGGDLDAVCGCRLGVSDAVCVLPTGHEGPHEHE